MGSGLGLGVVLLKGHHNAVLRIILRTALRVWNGVREYRLGVQAGVSFSARGTTRPFWGSTSARAFGGLGLVLGMELGWGLRGWDVFRAGISFSARGKTRRLFCTRCFRVWDGGQGLGLVLFKGHHAAFLKGHSAYSILGQWRTVLHGNDCKWIILCTAFWDLDKIRLPGSCAL